MSLHRFLTSFVVTILLFGSNSRAEALTLKIAMQEGFDKISAIKEVQNFVTLALESEGIHVTFRSLPLARSVALVNKGELDGELIRAANIVEQSPNLILTSKPLGYADYHILYSEKNTNFNQHQLKSYKGLVLLNSTTVKDELRKRDLKVDEAPSLEQGIQMVNSGRADYIILAAPIIAAIRDTQPQLFVNLKTSTEMFQRIPLYFCLNKKYKNLMPKIEKSFSRQAKKKNNYKYINTFINPNL
ncbi:type 2 periplasmic-binding domain-containing protein [Bdellovibrio svalbardensis]|uniref:Transporter substrate-binding domain-containing protein n=1 Tax=Bdellovibrio svalbardensis TaxID=2972972 RepID=A0ABT6DJ04_9BACT|nr:transporter substrate-binding domain-containing protein [Bdellovibrio svalbardensis]MDG0816836.1 transporter substrate-binding domain-containing protein [Bdellovibrio svalbardensis]